MRSTFYGLEVSRTGLYTAQNELNVTGHNISNVDTIGYTRQRLNTAAIPAQAMNVQFAVDNRATAGRGVEAQTIDQIRNLFTDIKYRAENTDTGYWTAMSEEFAIVESLFNSVLEKEITSASIYSAMDTFRAALSALDAEPSSKDVRTNLLTAAEQLTENFRYAYGKLEEQHEDINSAIKVMVDDINGIAESIANLNRQIFGYELTGAKANDLRDERNLLLDDLSEMVNIDYYENSQGYLVVNIGSRELVNGVEFNRLTVDPNGADNQLDVLGNSAIIGKQYSIVWADGMGQPSKNPRDVASIQGGKLRAYLDLRDGSTITNAGIPYAASLLNDLARKIAQEVNEVHRQGYTMPFSMASGSADLSEVKRYQAQSNYATVEFGVPTAFTQDGAEYYVSTTGINFFEVDQFNDYSKVTAKNFQVSSEIRTNVYLIAVSSEEVTVDGELNQDGTLNQKTGNQDNLKNMIALYDREDDAGNSDNFQDRLKTLVTSIGNQASKYNQMKSAQDVRLASLSDERQSVSGVSLDEEMTNIVRFTHAYNANARVITAIDEELDTLINRLGVVGR